MDVDGGNTNSHTLTGLTNGQTYTISIVGTSSSSDVVPSAPVLPGTVGLGKVVVGKQSSLHRTQVTFLRSTEFSYLLLSHNMYSTLVFIALFHSSTSSSTQ